jgi:hypothetical protein
LVRELEKIEKQQVNTLLSEDLVSIDSKHTKQLFNPSTPLRMTREIIL